MAGRLLRLGEIPYCSGEPSRMVAHDTALLAPSCFRARPVVRRGDRNVGQELLRLLRSWRLLVRVATYRLSSFTSESVSSPSGGSSDEGQKSLGDRRIHLGRVLIVFGAVALYMGINGYQTVGDELSKEYIVGGSDMAPAEIQRRQAKPGFRRPSSCRRATSSMNRSTPEPRHAASLSTCASTRSRRQAA